MIEKTHEDDLAYFIAFCVEIYKNDHHLNGADASEIFAKHNVMDFLANNYDVLHTQSPQWILDEINEFISK